VQKHERKLAGRNAPAAPHLNTSAGHAPRMGTRSMLSGNFMRSHISEVIPEENTNSNIDTDERSHSASNANFQQFEGTKSSERAPSQLEGSGKTSEPSSSTRFGAAKQGFGTVIEENRHESLEK
jgi:hypothetical protein